MVKKRSGAKVGAGLMAVGAAAAAGYYLYKNKNARRKGKIIAKELMADWKMVRSEAGKASRSDMARAMKVGKKVLASGKKTAKKLSKKSGVGPRRGR